MGGRGELFQCSKSGVQTKISLPVLLMWGLGLRPTTSFCKQCSWASTNCTSAVLKVTHPNGELNFKAADFSKKLSWQKNEATVKPVLNIYYSRWIPSNKWTKIFVPKFSIHIYCKINLYSADPSIKRTPARVRCLLNTGFTV